jgi:threonine/homoserine/homoserine lactone efflux protein
LKIFGACYLLFLAYKVFKSSEAINFNTGSVQEKSNFKLFQQGFMMNVLNPKVSLFFLALFPGFLFSETISETIQFYILGALFIFTSFLVFGSIALLAGSLKSYIERHPNAGIFLKWLQIVVFVGIAVFIVF